MKSLPIEIWNHVASWLLPLDKRRLALTRKDPLEKLTRSQLEIAEIWNKIFPRGDWPDKAMERGLKVALIGPVSSITKPSQNRSKPYLFLATTPGSYNHWQSDQLERELYKTIGGKKLPFNVERGLEREFDNFILNLGGAFHLNRDVKCPKELFESWQSCNSQEILYYHTSAVQLTKVSKCDAPYGYGVDFYVSLEDEQHIVFRCYNR
jgi:hypothetical protein